MMPGHNERENAEYYDEKRQGYLRNLALSDEIVRGRSTEPGIEALLVAAAGSPSRPFNPRTWITHTVSSPSLSS
jgi:hypothetical protein